jgi:short subunit dehydrogenase-like uncharacterized protein
MMDRDYDVVIYGATGFVGSRAGQLHRREALGVSHSPVSLAGGLVRVLSRLFNRRP